MTDSHTLIINEVIRRPETGPVDLLAFNEGVNVIVGPPNTGKTKWLQMLNYLLSSDDSAAEAFGAELAEKYTSLVARLTVAGEQWEIERRWDENTPKNRVILNSDPINVKEFRYRLLQRLAIPILHYPQGNPYGQRTWPELGWKSLFRHMYRRQLLWSDIADKQPESEQHACILQFTGLAQHLFSKEYGELVTKEKRIIELKAQKEQFLSVLSDVSKELLSAEEIGVGVTPQSLEDAKQRVRSQIDKLIEQRNTLLKSLAKQVAGKAGNQTGSEGQLEELSTELSTLENRLQEMQIARERNRTRLSDMQSYCSSVQQELERLLRAQKAGTVLVDLKITHCPACDRPVEQTESSSECFLCHRQYDQNPSTTSVQRLEMEVDQAKAVFTEGVEMIEVLRRDNQRLESEIVEIEQRIRQIHRLLLPVRSAAVAVLPPEIGIIDRKLGQLQEQLAQLDRVSKSLLYREILTEEIDRIQSETASLEEVVAKQGSELDFERASDSLADGMTTFLNAIKKASPNAWPHKPVRVRIDEKRTRFLIGEQRKWSTQLGGTHTLYFLISYHYALMTLANCEQCHFPGFLAIDFPAELPDGTTIQDKENFVIEPFIKLLASDGFPKCQVIAAGNAFEKLEGASRIELSHVWS